MGASWRSWPSWIATSCAVPRVRGRSRRWWPGRWARHRRTRTRSPPWRTGWRSFRAARQGMREGRLSLDQVGVIADRAGEGSDEHYAELARGAPRSASCAPLSSWNRDPNPIRNPNPNPPPSRGVDHQDHRRGSSAAAGSNFAHTDAAKFDAALQSHHDALIAEWKHDHDRPTTAPHPDQATRRCRAPARRSCGWSRPGGTPRPRAGPTGSTPRW